MFPVDTGISKTKHAESVLRYAISNSFTPQQAPVWDMTGFNSFSIQIDNGGLSPNSSFSISGSNDLANWSTLPVTLVGNTCSIIKGTFYASNNGAIVLVANKSTKYVKINYSGGNTLHRINVLRSSAYYIAEKKELMYAPDSFVTYVSPVGGITASPVTLFPGLSPTYLNMLTDIQITNSGTAMAELSILNGAAGTSLWTQQIPAGVMFSYNFKEPLLGSSGNLLQLKLTSTAALIVSVNAQGSYIKA